METRINTRAPDGANKKVESLLESWQSQVTTMNMSLKPFINFSAGGNFAFDACAWRNSIMDLGSFWQ